MGRIFETRKATMFARWDKMSKAFARIGKEITIAVKAAGPNPEAEAFFHALAQFYRKAYLRYIDATKRHPEQRPERIAEVVALLAGGVKERPKQ